MGLDMYLNKRKYIGGSYSHRKVAGTIKLTIGAGTDQEEMVEIPSSEVSEIVMSGGYWRKANQIHSWFVKNVQGGEDNCQESYVSIEQLAELKGLCEFILKARELHGQDSPEVLTIVNDMLPPSSGFFFGSTDIDDYYFQDLEETVEILSNLDESLDYYYQASW
jgi:hypothetical protein